MKKNKFPIGKHLWILVNLYYIIFDCIKFKVYPLKYMVQWT